MKEERIAKLRELIKQDPNDSFSRYALALEYAGLGENVQAATLLEDLTKIDPHYVPSFQQLGYLYQKLDRREDAIAVLKRGIQVAVEEGDLHARSEMQDALDELEM